MQPEYSTALGVHVCVFFLVARLGPVTVWVGVTLSVCTVTSNANCLKVVLPRWANTVMLGGSLHLLCIASHLLQPFGLRYTVFHGKSAEQAKAYCLNPQNECLARFKAGGGLEG